jgi:hypothetical protein
MMMMMAKESLILWVCKDKKKLEGNKLFQPLPTKKKKDYISCFRPTPSIYISFWYSLNRKLQKCELASPCLSVHLSVKIFTTET